MPNEQDLLARVEELEVLVVGMSASINRLYRLYQEDIHPGLSAMRSDAKRVEALEARVAELDARTPRMVKGDFADNLIGVFQGDPDAIDRIAEKAWADYAEGRTRPFPVEDDGA